jgi:hypothetical protein
MPKRKNRFLKDLDKANNKTKLKIFVILMKAPKRTMIINSVISFFDLLGCSWLISDIIKKHNTDKLTFSITG